MRLCIVRDDGTGLDFVSKEISTLEYNSSDELAEDMRKNPEEFTKEVEYKLVSEGRGFVLHEETKIRLARK